MAEIGRREDGRPVPTADADVTWPDSPTSMMTAATSLTAVSIRDAPQPARRNGVPPGGSPKVGKEGDNKARDSAIDQSVVILNTDGNPEAAPRLSAARSGLLIFIFCFAQFIE